MKQIKMGPSTLSIPAMALGIMRMDQKSVTEAADAISAAYGEGINFIDSSDIYGGGKSETVFGQALKQTKISRDKLFIQSKTGIVPGKRYDFSKKHILTAVDGILERMQIDYLDSLVLHRPDILMNPEYINDSKLLLLDEGWKYFPKTYEEIAEHGLPMSGKIEGVEITTDMQAISITLDRTVVKLHLTVENATNDELKLQWVEFGKFISDRVYLFRHTQLDVPESTLYKTLRYPETGNFSGVTLSPNGKTQWSRILCRPCDACNPRWRIQRLHFCRQARRNTHLRTSSRKLRRPQTL